MWKTHFGNGHRWHFVFCNGQRARYRSRKVTDWCPLLITRIRNGHQITTITTTSHRSREMAVSLVPQRTLVTGINTEPVAWTQHWRRVMWTCVSSVSTKADTSFARVSPLSWWKEKHFVYTWLLCFEVLSTRVSDASTKGDTCCVCMFPVSWWKEMHAVYARLLYLH
jgi:hypothetical protein